MSMLHHARPDDSNEDGDLDLSDGAFPRNSPMSCNYSWTLLAMKRAVDIAASLIFFACFGWMYLIIALGVLLTSGGPTIYSQPRYGRGGKVFRFYKFRSMVQNSDAVMEEHLRVNAAARQQWHDFQKLEKDPRITRFGNLIRKTSLDELPQFWNVLKGDMSLVGPRPCMLSQQDLYGSDWSYYCAVRPGITGLWQVSGRNKLSFKARVALDVKYVESLSMLGDIQIFFKTVWVVFTGHGSR